MSPILTLLELAVNQHTMCRARKYVLCGAWKSCCGRWRRCWMAWARFCRMPDPRRAACACAGASSYNCASAVYLFILSFSLLQKQWPDWQKAHAYVQTRLSKNVRTVKKWCQEDIHRNIDYKSNPRICMNKILVHGKTIFNKEIQLRTW